MSEVVCAVLTLSEDTSVSGEGVVLIFITDTLDLESGAVGLSNNLNATLGRHSTCAQCRCHSGDKE
jgi:hypothetical protein